MFSEIKKYVFNELNLDIAQDLINWTEMNVDKLPFKSLFGNDLRFLIPFVGSDKNASTILQKLKEKGNLDFKTGTFSSGNRNIRFSKYVLNSGNFTNNEINWWQKSPNPIQQLQQQNELDKYSIIISRNPIDLARMSDHDGWTSCHAPSREYFKCALSDAKGAGAIAYVVLKDDLKNVKNLQEPEIFIDDKRHSKGIKPIARLRLRKFIHKEEGYDLAIPESTIYGSRIPGFKESLIKWFNDNQQDKLKGERPRLKDFHLVGGSYQDTTGGSLFNAFFGDTLDKGQEATYDGEDDQQSMIDQMTEELKNIDREYSKKFTFIKTYYDINDDGDEPYVYFGATLKVELPNNLIKHPTPLNYQKLLNKVKSNFSQTFMHVEEIELDDDVLVLTLTSDEMGVDSYRDFCENLFDDLEEKKDEVIHYLYQELYYVGLLNSTKAMKTFHDYHDNKDIHFQNFEIQPIDDYSYNIEVENKIEIPIKTSWKKTGYKNEMFEDCYYNYTFWTNRFSIILKQKMQEWHQRFIFMSKRQKTLFPVDNIKSYNINMNIQPQIQFYGKNAGHRSIEKINPPTLQLSFKLSLLTQDEDYDDVINYVNFLDKNFVKFKDLLLQINDQVAIEFNH